jgi:glycosyltransferase involved in cell wall biosynthesis
MKSIPKVSVIIPAYNRKAYIDQTIQCVLDQSYSNIEFIVVDDGSSDGTYERICMYSDQLTVITHPEHLNRGQSASINLGLRCADGEYIAILDSDDYWELNKLERQVDYMEKHPDVGLIYSNGYGVDASGQVIYNCHLEDHQELNDPNLVLMDCYIALPVNSLVRKSVYDQVGEFNESYRAAQDHDMLIRIAETTKFAYIPDFLWYYRRHGGSISSTQQELRWRVGFKILENAVKRYPYKKKTIRKRRAVLHYRLGVCFVKEKKYYNWIGNMIMSFMYDPFRALKVAFGFEINN